MYIYRSGCMEVYRRNITHAHIILYINRLTLSSYIYTATAEGGERVFIRTDKKKCLYKCSRVHCIAAAIQLYQAPAQYSGKW